MGTRASIAVERDNGDIEHVYVNSEGQPLGGLGQMLLRYHGSYDAACELIALGDLSWVGIKRAPDPEAPHKWDAPQPGITVAYARDRGDRDAGARRSVDLTQWRHAREELACEYFYIWCGSGREGSQWFILTKVGLQPLKEFVAHEIALEEQAERDDEYRIAQQKQQDLDDSQID